MPGFTPFRFLCGINIERWQSETAPVASTIDARQRFSPRDHTSRAVQDSLSSVCSVRTIATAEGGCTRDNALPGFGSFPIGLACSSRPVWASEQLVWSGRFMDYLAHEKYCSLMGAGGPVRAQLVREEPPGKCYGNDVPFVRYVELFAGGLLCESGIVEVRAAIPPMRSPQTRIARERSQKQQRA